MGRDGSGNGIQWLFLVFGASTTPGADWLYVGDWVGFPRPAKGVDTRVAATGECRLLVDAVIVAVAVRERWPEITHTGGCTLRRRLFSATPPD